jgi:hypothetical protein
MFVRRQVVALLPCRGSCRFVLHVCWFDLAILCLLFPAVHRPQYLSIWQLCFSCLLLSVPLPWIGRGDNGALDWIIMQ